MLIPSDLPDLDATVARRLIVTARSIAPCLDSLEGDALEDAIAVLAGVAANLPGAGMGRVKSQSRNGTSITWADYSSAFGSDDRAALRALCAAATGPVGGPVGSFPPSTIGCLIWPPEPTA